MTKEESLKILDSILKELGGEPVDKETVRKDFEEMIERTEKAICEDNPDCGWWKPVFPWQLSETEKAYLKARDEQLIQYSLSEDEE